jgi:ribosome-binding factor A
MKSRKPSQRQILSSCHEIGPDDGVDPRTFFRRPSRQRTNRKALQMCGEIARTLSAVLAWESGDDLLRCVTVVSVEPAPDSTRVLVRVCIPQSADVLTPSQVLEGLHRLSGKLRTEVAGALHRKRVPELVFQVVTGGEVRP